MEELDLRETELMKREAEIARRERAIKAREALAEAGLPHSLAAHLDYASDEALEQGLTLAKEARRLTEASALGLPKASAKRVPGQADYAQRALLYQTDRNDYLDQYKGER